MNVKKNRIKKGFEKWEDMIKENSDFSRLHISLAYVF